MGVNLKNMWETALFSGKIYTADKKFTQPLVAAVATNFKSVDKLPSIAGGAAGIAYVGAVCGGYYGVGISYCIWMPRNSWMDWKAILEPSNDGFKSKRLNKEIIFTQIQRMVYLSLRWISTSTSTGRAGQNGSPGGLMLTSWGTILACSERSFIEVKIMERISLSP